MNRYELIAELIVATKPVRYINKVARWGVELEWDFMLPEQDEAKLNRALLGIKNTVHLESKKIAKALGTREPQRSSMEVNVEREPNQIKIQIKARFQWRNEGMTWDDVMDVMKEERWIR